MKWIEFSVQAHAEAVDAIAEVFRAHGTGGVSIEQPIEADSEGEVEPVPIGMPLIKAYLPVTDNLRAQEQRIDEALWHLQAFNLSPVGPLQRREIDEEDWANGWKQHFHPLKIGEIVIKPTWRDWQKKPGEIIVELDPGMAFGTGLHPTTAMTLETLQQYVKSGRNVLDLGAGSGILAMAAAHLGAQVTALDISDVAVEVAGKNIANNGLAGRIRVAQGSIDAVRGEKFALILANIIASVLIDLAQPLHDALEPDGLVLASGIIEERAHGVRKAFAGAGLVVEHERSEGDWWLFIARRPA